MRIQHNIMAMNAYRNYNTNNKALSGNLEKLSSGYKINRAGDDAAGLAISEKMRAQITGLNAAQKNVKDGISLVKTAEGAMQEIQDMLNRMDYLATQSANGTYDNEVDRANLQKEVTALKTEIDRIAESANFNGIQLLDGSKDADGAAAALAAAQDAAKAAQATADAATQKLENIKNSNASLSAEQLKTYAEEMDVDSLILADSTSNGGAGSPIEVGTKTIYETEAAADIKPSFRVKFDGVTHTMAGTGLASNGAMTISITPKGVGTGSASTISITEKDIYDYLEAKGADVSDLKGKTISSEDLAGAFAYKIQQDPGKVGNSAAASAVGSPAGVFSDGLNVWTVKTGADEGATDTTKKTDLVFSFSGSGNQPLTSDLNKHFDIRMTGAAETYVPPTTNKYTTEAVTFASGGTGTAQTGTLTATVNYTDETGASKSVAVTLSFDSSTTTHPLSSVANFATAVAAALNKNADFAEKFKATANSGALELENRMAYEGESKMAVTGITFAGTGDFTSASAAEDTDGKVVGKDGYYSGTTGYTNAGTEVVAKGSPNTSAQLASTTLDLSGTDITDGMQITLGDETYTFAVGKDSIVSTKDENGNEIANVIDMTKFNESDLKSTGGSTTVRAAAFSKLSELAKENKTFTVSHAGTAGHIGLKQRQDVKESTEMKDRDQLLSFISIKSIDKAAAQDEADQLKADSILAQEKVVADAQAAADAAQATADAAAEKDGKPLTLQIGDTSDSYNQMQVTIGDMHVAAMGTMKREVDENGKEQLTTTVDGAENSVANVDISTQEGAQKAIDVIKNAINYVSGVRGDLGAIQNRLDHTANNLSVMAENIQDAESTIRDTDVAEEMMSYVKNNILVQSAQAMLAQANQVPQGVLQLLG